MPVPLKSTITLSLACAVAVVMSAPVTPQGRQQQVAFVGCPSDGQAGYVEPPRDSAKTVTVTEVSASEIAYYKGAMAPGAFGPRGWHCHAWYGSGGALLLITPEVLGPTPGSAWPPKTSGQAVEIVLDDGATS